MKRPIYLSIVLAGSLALVGLLAVLPPLPFALPSAQLACHGKGQCDLQQPLEKPPNDSSSFNNHEIISQPSQTNQAISVSEKGQANFATSSEASETQSVQFESNLKF